MTVASKWGYTYTAGWRVDADPPEVKDLSAVAFERQLAETRERLGDHLSLYQIHSATLESGVLEDEQVLAGLRDLRARGVGVGLTVTGPEQAATVDRATEAGLFDTVQATWNLLEPSAGPALARAHDAGMGVVIKEALANGRLTAQGGEPRLLEAAARAGVAPDVLALAAVLAQPFADVVLSGAVTTGQLEANLAAARAPWTPELQAALAPLAMRAEAYWARRSEMRWT